MVKYGVGLANSENQIFNPEEIAIRFKHRIVSIHCFANGNGRHSRLMADIIIDNIFGMPVFSWGATNLVKQGDVRTNYLKAVRLADGGKDRDVDAVRETVIQWDYKNIFKQKGVLERL